MARVNGEQTQAPSSLLPGEDTLTPLSLKQLWTCVSSMLGSAVDTAAPYQHSLGGADREERGSEREEAEKCPPRERWLCRDMNIDGN